MAARRLTAERGVETAEEREVRERRERRREAWKAESQWARKNQRGQPVRVERVERTGGGVEDVNEVDDAMIEWMNREEVPKSPSTAPAPHQSPVVKGKRESLPSSSAFYPVPVMQVEKKGGRTPNVRVEKMH